MSTISSMVSSIYAEQTLVIQGINTFNIPYKSNNSSTNSIKSTSLEEETSNNSTSSELSNSDYAEIQDLKNIDRKVHAHELAHIAVGGRFAGGASYEYQVGPDNMQYAVGGEVPISLITGNTPSETIQNMTQIIAAALAPSDPSPQDRGVASSAGSYIQKAVADLYANTQKNLHKTSEMNSSLSLYI